MATNSKWKQSNSKHLVYGTCYKKLYDNNNNNNKHSNIKQKQKRRKKKCKMDNKRPNIQIKNAHPRLREYIFYLERKDKTRDDLILKIKSLEQEIKELRAKIRELILLNDRLQCDQILNQIIIKSDIAETAASNDKSNISISNINNSIEKLNLSSNRSDPKINESSIEANDSDKFKLPNPFDKIEEETDNGKGKKTNNTNNCGDTDNENDKNNDNDDDDDDSDNDDSDTADDDEDTGNSIIIKHVNKNYIKNGLEHFIHDLSRPMNIKLCIDDIKAVNERKRKFINNNEFDSIILLVCFNKRQMKINFLQYKEKLQKHPIFCSLEIEDYVSDRTFQLYRYAKILKHQYNYAAIYWRNNRVYGQKSKSTTDCIEIKSRSHVNKLKKLETKQGPPRRNMKNIIKKAK